ncbi:MFS transporter, aromatic acid:H+ symporter (AAHS) family [Marinibacterium anthonyi]|nr:MFS transporter, aromatic acid:H+ symporter (AAHS) family [Marinibacterium anthonyi]
MKDTSHPDTSHPDEAAVRQPALATALALTTCSQITATSSVLALTTIPTIVAAALGVAPHLIGYQVSLIYASGVLFSMIASGLVDRWGAGRVGQMALIGAGLGFLGMATGTLAGIALASVLIGIGYALNNPSSSHILSILAPPKRRNLIFSIKQAGVPLGGMLAALILPPLSHLIGWQSALLLAGLLPLGLAAIYQAFQTPWNADRIPGTPVGSGLMRGQRTVWRDPSLRTLCILGFLYSGVQLSLSTFLVAMLIEQFSWAPVAAASVAALLQAFGAVGRVFWGLVADWLKSGFLVLALIGLIAGLALTGFALYGVAPGLALIVTVIAGLTGTGWNGVLLAETARSSPGTGTLTGEVLAYTFVGVMVGPASFAAIFALIQDFALTFLLFSSLAFVGAVLSWRQHLVLRSQAT